MDECDSKCLNYFHKNRDLSPKKNNSAVYPFAARCFYTLYSLYVLYIYIPLYGHGSTQLPLQFNVRSKRSDERFIFYCVFVIHQHKCAVIRRDVS